MWMSFLFYQKPLLLKKSIYVHSDMEIYCYISKKFIMQEVSWLLHISVIKLSIVLSVYILYLEGRLKYVGGNISNMFSFLMLISMHTVVGYLIEYILFWVVHIYWWFDKRWAQLQWNIWLNNVRFFSFLSFFCFVPPPPLKSSTFKLC